MGFLSRIWSKPKTEERAITVNSFPGLVVPTSSGLNVSPRTALQIPAVYAAVSGVADTISTLPVGVYVRGEQGGEREVDHPADQLLDRRPNDYQTSKTYRATQVVDLYLYGEHFSEIVFLNDGVTPAELHRIEPERVRTEWDKYGHRLVYFVDGQEIEGYRLLHVVGFSIDGLRGVSPLGLCRDSLGLTLALERFGSSFFKNGARPSGILTTPPGLSPEDRTEAKTAWQTAHSGVTQAGETAVLPSGFSYQPFALAPEEGQYHESRIDQLRECQRITRTPPTLSMDYERQTWSNIQYARSEFVQNTIRPILVALEQEYNRKLLTQDEQGSHYFHHETEHLLRGSYSEQITALNMATGGPVLTPNEGRAQLGLPALPEGDSLRGNANGQATSGTQVDLGNDQGQSLPDGQDVVGDEGQANQAA